MTRNGWAKDGDWWVRQVGAFRLVVYNRGGGRWRWSVRGPDYYHFGDVATARDAKATALEVATRQQGELK